MGRIRTIKPDFFKHEGLFDAEMETGLPLRVAFAGLWCVADREGRFEWRPRALKTDVLPYDEVDFPRVLDALATRGFLVRYACQGREYGFIPGWRRHQSVNNKERPSDLPEPPENLPEHPKEQELTNASATRDPRDSESLRNSPGEGEGKGKGKEGKEEDSSEVDKPPSEPTHDEQGYRLIEVDGQVLHGRRVCAFPVVGEKSCNGHAPRWSLDLRTLDEFVTLYPSLDADELEQEFLKAQAWLEANPKRRKTRGGMRRFLTNWVNRAVNGSAT